MEISYHECDREAWACSLPSCTTAISPELCWCFFFSGWVKICVRFTVESFVGFTSLLIKRNSDAWKRKSTSRTGRADSRDPMAWTINTITFITSFGWLYCSISSSIWVQSSKPQSPLSGTQLKDVILGYSDAVLVLAVSSSNIILKRSF